MSKVGIIGGGGWLGGAVAERGLDAEVLASSALMVSGRTPRGERLAQWPDVGWTSDNCELASQSDIVILSVRPEDFQNLDLDLEGKLVISLMAGISIATIARKLGSQRIVRTMPNAAAAIGRSFTAWVATAQVTEADRAFVSRLFCACGDEVEVADERQLDFLSGLSGTGPAYPALLAQALLEHAVASGIPATVARRAVRGIVSAAGLMDSDAFDPAGTVKTFLAYNGVTAAGLAEMIQKGLPGSVGAGLDAAAAAAAEMARRYST